MFYFDLACPFSYLAAERVDRAFAAIEWRPTMAAELRGPVYAEVAERRARELRLPLVWPDNPGSDVPGAMRAAAHATQLGRGAAFALAAGRLAYGGGYDLEDLDVLAEAAAAAGVSPDECVRAAGDEQLDAPMRDRAQRLLGVGGDRLPALSVGRTLFSGERRVADAAAAARLAEPQPLTAS